MTSLINEIYSKQGAKGFFRGLGPFLLTEIPHSMIELPLYEIIRKKFTKNQRFLTSQESFLTGMIAGSLAAFITHPIDVVKTNIIVDKITHYKGFLDCSLQLYKKKGILVFYRGVLPRMGYCASVSVLFFTFYENIRSIIFGNIKH